MAREMDDMMNNAIHTGLANRDTIEMARRHCIHMKFVRSGGSGMAEQATGLPIDMRQIKCPVANDASMGMALDFLAANFYIDHCIGCTQREPTGELPNLESLVMEHQQSARLMSEEAAEIASERHQQWMHRVEKRRSLSVSADSTMMNALDAIGFLDLEPGNSNKDVVDERKKALNRLTALSEKTPALFTEEIVDIALELVMDNQIYDLLGPLRHLARTRTEFAARVAFVAAFVLKSGPMIEAGRCLADLSDFIDVTWLDPTTIRSLIILAGAPPQRHFGSSSKVTHALDPSGLRAAIAIAPKSIDLVLREMLPPAKQTSNFIIPPGTIINPTPTSDFDRTSAANAVRVLAESHPEFVSDLATTLLRNLAVPENDRYENHPLSAIQRTLAVLIALDLADIFSQAEDLGGKGSDELRLNIFRSFARVGEMLDLDSRWNESGDPPIEQLRRLEIFDRLLTISASKLSSDWGDDVRISAGEIIEGLAEIDPPRMLANLSTLLGSFLAVINAQSIAASSLITAPSSTPRELQVLEEMARRQSVSNTLGRILKAVEFCSTANPQKVCREIVALIEVERAADSTSFARTYLIELLGKIGYTQGLESHVLQIILPTLHSYLVDTDVLLRASALDAWANIGSMHQLPSSVSQLLPALINDRHNGVIRSVLSAARRLQWANPEQTQLLLHALFIAVNIDAKKSPDILKEAIRTALLLAGENDEFRSTVESSVLLRAGDLDGYDLRDVLENHWLAVTQHSAEMAKLRLRQAADPRINDRYNAREDKELCALLDCDDGLITLPLTDLKSAALQHAPDYPLASAEYAEILWRAGRSSEATMIMEEILRSIPVNLAYSHQRSLASLIAKASKVDSSALSNGDWREEIGGLAEILQSLATSESKSIQNLVLQLKAHSTIRFLITGDEPTSFLAIDGTRDSSPDVGNPPSRLRLRAVRLRIAGETLKTNLHIGTVTGIYNQALVELCNIGSFLLKAEAATLEADSAEISTCLTAAQRRADLLFRELTNRFSTTDPLVGPLLAVLSDVCNLQVGTRTESLFTNMSILSMPLQIIQGPKPVKSNIRKSSLREKAPKMPVAVVLASIDGNLITGPQVLRPNFVYELTLEVQTDSWPDWADRLEIELISHLSDDLLTRPIFTWQRNDRSSKNETYRQSGSLIVKFGLNAGQPAQPLLVRPIWRGKRDGVPIYERLDVAGHNELRLRPFDPTRDFVTDFPVFDERLLSLYDQLSRADYDQEHLAQFSRLLTTICRVGLRMTWEKEYRKGTKVRERKFHDDLYERLLAEPELDGRIERGSRLALGFFDIRHDKITAELKVERETPVTQKSAGKYIGQPTQYAAADGARLSILAILDMSTKKLPIGTPENYLFTLDPHLHGLDNPEAPGLVAVVVINGNMPTPSSWSRSSGKVSQGASGNTKP